MITREEFNDGLKTFVEAYSKTDAESLFTLYETNKQSYAEQRHLIENKGRRVHRLISITYNEAYCSPVLWFNFYDLSGKLLYLNEFEHLLSTNHTSIEILKGLSQNEHPIHGIAFYNIHPCKTSEFMKNFITRKHYISSWLSVYGAILGLGVSDVFLNAEVL